MAAGKQGCGPRFFVVPAVVVGGFIFLMWAFSDDNDNGGAQRELPTARAVSKPVSSAEVSPWPFTVDSGVLRCRPASRAVTFQPGGKGDEYALNGAAKTVGYPSVETYWALDPQAPAGSGLRVSLSEAVAVGAALC